MSDAWRRKRYYAPRVLIGTADTLDPPLEDAVVCITGAQRNLLQNLMQYLHRRSTFVSEYHTDYYLAPTEAEWEQLQVITGDLEEKLMNCDAFTAKLDAILDAALCACQSLGSGYGSEVTPAIYSDLEDAGTVAWVLPDGSTTPAGDDRCALAQLVWAMAYEVLTEYLQPLQEAAHHVLLPAVLAAIAVMLGGPVALLPGAALYGIIVAALDAWVEGELQSVETELLAQKQNLICAMYDAWVLAGDYADAASAAATVIDNSSQWTAIDKALFKLMFSPFAMEICQDAWTAQSTWAVANVTPGYCASCPATGERIDYWNFDDGDWQSPDWTLYGGAVWWTESLPYGCGEHELLCDTDSESAEAIVTSPGPGLHDLLIEVNGWGQFGEDSQVDTYGSATGEAPWTPLHNFWLPNFATENCGWRQTTFQDVDLSGYSHIKYRLKGIGVVAPVFWMQVRFTWTLPT